MNEELVEGFKTIENFDFEEYDFDHPFYGSDEADCCEDDAPIFLYTEVLEDEGDVEDEGEEEIEGEDDDEIDEPDMRVERNVDESVIRSDVSHTISPYISHPQHRNAIISRGKKLIYQTRNDIFLYDPVLKHKKCLISIPQKELKILSFAVDMHLNYLGVSLMEKSTMIPGCFLVKNLETGKIFRQSVYKGYRVNTMKIIGNLVHVVGQSDYYVVYQINEVKGEIVILNENYLRAKLGTMDNPPPTFGNFLTISHNRNYLVTSTDYYGICLFKKLKDNNVYKYYKADIEGYSATACDFVHFNSDDTFLAVAAQSFVYIYRAEDFSLFDVVEVPRGTCSICKFHRQNQNILALTSYGNSSEPAYSYFYIYDLQKKEFLYRIKFNCHTKGFTFEHPMGNKAYVATQHHRLYEFTLDVSLCTNHHSRVVLEEKRDRINFVKNALLLRTGNVVKTNCKSMKIETKKIKIFLTN